MFKSQKPNPQIDGIFDIEPQELLSGLTQFKDQLQIIDVRQPDEYTGELGHIKEAELLVLDHLPQKFSSLPKNKTLVMVCRSGGRSARATAFLKEQGYNQVFNMRGGMLLWNELGLPTAKS